LLNSDVEVTEGWLAPLENLLVHRSDIDAVQPKILSYHDKTRFEYAGAAGGFIDKLGYPFCRGRMFTEVEEDKGQYDDERAIFWATGACFLIRAKAFREAGGFDEDFFAHMEEIDVCWKIHRTGRKVFYCGKSRVYHKGAGTLGYDSPMKTYLNFRNGLFLILKHFDTAELLYKLPVRLALDWAAALVFLLRGKTKNAASVLRAHAHFIRQFRGTLKKRKAIRSAHPWYDHMAIYPGLIVVDFYLRRKPRYQ
jgi:GT2 family glycosyltransferase